MTMADGARLVALGVAVLGVVDPAIGRAGRERPVVALLTSPCPSAPCASEAVAARIGDELSRDFEIRRGAYPGAAATVLAGDALPEHAAHMAGPIFVVRPDNATAGLRIEAVTAPARAHLDSRIPIRVRVAGTAGRTGTLHARLTSGGVLLDRVAHELAGDAAPATIEMVFLPTSEGPARVTVDIDLDGAGHARADTAVDVVRDRWRVLFFDRRPSWLSTFVRREIERDSRFDVHFRTRTSRDIAVATSDAPARLAPSSIDAFDAVVLSASDAMTRGEVDAIDAFTRYRGGTVLLLVDAPPGETVTTFLGTSGWSLFQQPEATTVPLAVAGAPPLVASEFVMPATTPPGTEVLASLRSEGAAERPVVFSMARGLGRIVVFGAADAWRSRGDSPSRFADLWRVLLANTAADSMAAIDLRLDQSVARPGDTVAVAVMLRDVRGRPVDTERRAEVGAVIEGGDGTHHVRLWPDGAPGRFRGTMRASATPGVYRIQVRRGDDVADTPLLVAADVVVAQPDDRALLELWASTHGGRVFSIADLSAMRAALAAAIAPEPREIPWHPMRSAWWIVPFAVALAVDWASRRRPLT